MSSYRKSLVALEREAHAEREKLTACVIELRQRLKPAALAAEATAHLKSASSDALHEAALKAKTPLALGAAVAALALGGLAYGLRARHAPGCETRVMDARTLEVQVPLRESYAVSEPYVDAPRHGLVKTSFGIATAVAVGAFIGKLLPISANEKNIWRSVKHELSDAFDEWTHRQAAELVRPKPGKPLSAANLCALGLGLLLATKARGAA